MQASIFHKEENTPGDSTEIVLKNISQNIIIVVFGLLPLLCIPISFFSLDYMKVLFVVSASFLALIFFSLSVLRSGQVKFVTPIALVAFFGIAAITSLSALFSGDILDSFIGQSFEVHTALFVVLLTLVMMITTLLDQTKMTIMRLYILLTVSTALLALFHVSRLFLGSEFLSLGIFTQATDSPVGGWNDLALFFGLSILLSLVALEQLPLTKWGKGIFSVGIMLSLAMLTVINFFAVWIVLALVSLIVLIYTLTKDRFSQQALPLTKKQAVSVQSIFMSISVFVVSLLFIIGGSAAGGFVANITGVSYVEVRPSFEATIDIARNVYDQNAFLGIGPNKFADAWRLYKDPAINQTVFWATDFRGGAGYIPTQFVTVGILGTAAWVIFFGLFLVTGFRMLFKTAHSDRFWYFIGSSSFIASAYLWSMSIMYVPGATILLLAAIFTSITFTAYAALTGSKSFSFSMLKNKQTGVILVGFVMVTIVASASILYYLGRHTSALYTYGDALTSITEGSVITDVEQKIVKAYELFKNDTFARQIASYQLAKMNTLLSLEEPSVQQQQEFQNAVQNGINAGQLAVSADPTDAINWSVLGSIYSILAGVGVEGAVDRAQESFASARKFDPTNPLYVLSEAQLLSRVGDYDASRTLTQEAIRLKANYTDALFFLTQLDIAAGDAEAAAATTQAIISLEPNNPARYYQLGVLELSNNHTEEAVTAFEQAIQRDVDYANARYFLAVAYAQLNQIDEALEQLSVVLELNPGNEQVTSLISQLQSGDYQELSETAEVDQIEEPEIVSTTEDVVTTTQAPDTSLITPINIITDDSSEEEVSTDGAENIQDIDETSSEQQ